MNTIAGGIAQLGEHLPCTQGVKGSSPFASTSKYDWTLKTAYSKVKKFEGNKRSRY